MKTLVFHDLSPFDGELAAEDEAWLAHLAEFDARRYCVGVAGDGTDAEWQPLVERASDGQWRAGRFIGAVTAAGRRLVVEPRLGVGIVEAWLDEALGLSAPPSSARHERSDTFIVRLLARVWCRSVDAATRHGLPILRLPRQHEGLYVRGRLDSRRTTQLLGEGRPHVASISYDRSLEHPVTRTIVCADRAIAQLLAGSAEWRTDRVKQIMPHLRSGAGPRPRLPSLHELSRVRYTPITMPFRSAALLSHRIASRLGYGATDDAGDAEGLLIDVAELWELFVLNCARRACPSGVRAEHGTTARRRDFLLRSTGHDAGMGKVKPDILIYRGDSLELLLDAKYKRLVNSRERPNGVDQADLYQLTAYAVGLKPTGVSMLAFPAAPGSPDRLSTAEHLGPWLCGDQTLAFTRLPVRADECRDELRKFIGLAPQA